MASERASGRASDIWSERRHHPVKVAPAAADGSHYTASGQQLSRLVCGVGVGGACALTHTHTDAHTVELLEC